MKTMVIALVLVSVVASLLHFASCNSNDHSFKDKNIQQGFQLSQKYCNTCHLLPEPDLLNKITWAEYVLPKMGGMLGFQRFASDYIELSDTAQSLTLEQWKNIVRYYVSQAPENPIERSASSPEIITELPYFKIEMPVTTVKAPATTMVLVNTDKKEIVFADGITEHLYILSSDRVTDSVKIGIGISAFHSNDSGFTALAMGVLHPSDSKNGRLYLVGKDSSKSMILIDSLQRPVHAGYSDLNNDGKQDIIVCEFGNATGLLSWFERKSEIKFVKHVLRAFPGAVKTEVYDFNRDGRQDIMALMAQGDEGFFIYYNQGNANFREQRIVRLSPSFGSNYFELADFNNDGFPDILASNGDNGDYPPIKKAYHGIRIYLNNGNNEFSEKIFLAVNGVGKVMAKDFDADGDLDLASISYFPDFKQTPEESFIFWRNDGELHFHPASFAESSAGRWLTMDANDIDEDGDIDIVLGNARFPLGDIPPELMRKWNVYSPSVLILRNTLH
ncbi:MAG: VCBS repeat-containing protein [Chitinophagaceae bacterium]|nr:VCBS repeat-containing protein [Chitinophagaceae bacterium]